MKEARIIDSKGMKWIESPDYNYSFDKTNGMFARWGKTINDDPDYSPVGPEILDIEVTTKCKGPGGKLCSFCYKANTPNGTNMSLEDFKTILHKMPKTLTQCAFGADAQAESNPDLFSMMDYCRTNEYNQIVPNITVADISNNTADRLVDVCGAVAVSRYADKDICYNSVSRLTSRGLKQTNIHIMISEETYEQALETIHDRIHDERLKDLNAIVFLSLKQKGRGKGHTPLSQEKFNTLVEKAFELGVGIGFDSCSAPKFLESIKDREDAKKLEVMVEPCESSAFSAYINSEGDFYPCSFSEDEGDWANGISVVKCDDFMKDIWNAPRVTEFRDNLLKCKRNCPLFKV